jgi:hypothetical protein
MSNPRPTTASAIFLASAQGGGSALSRRSAMPCRRRARGGRAGRSTVSRRTWATWTTSTGRIPEDEPLPGPATPPPAIAAPAPAVPGRGRASTRAAAGSARAASGAGRGSASSGGPGSDRHPLGSGWRKRSEDRSPPPAPFALGMAVKYCEVSIMNLEPMSPTGLTFMVRGTWHSLHTVRVVAVGPDLAEVMQGGSPGFNAHRAA